MFFIYLLFSPQSLCNIPYSFHCSRNHIGNFSSYLCIYPRNISSWLEIGWSFRLLRFGQTRGHVDTLCGSSFNGYFQNSGYIHIRPGGPFRIDRLHFPSPGKSWLSLGVFRLIDLYYIKLFIFYIYPVVCMLKHYCFQNSF